MDHTTGQASASVLPLMVLAVVGALVWWAYPLALSPLRTGGIVAGWIGSGLLLVSLLLMIREPRLARWLGGLEPMFRWHHALGVWAYVVLLIHPLLLAADGWSESPALAWATLAPWEQGWPVWLAWASLLCMMAGLLVTLSPRPTYALWRRLHHLLSLSVVLGAAHLVVLGLDAMLLAVPALILLALIWRLLRADLGLGAQPYVVQRVEHLSPTTVELTLQPLVRPLRNASPAQAGQFVLAAFGAGPRFPGCSEFHPFTLSAVGPEGRLALAIKALGDCTRHLQSIQAGAEARVQGPFGHFLADSAGPGLWVAGGIGITPFIAALRQGPLVHPVRMIYLHREGPDAPYVQELRDLATRQPQLRLRIEDTGSALPDLTQILPAAAELPGLDCFLCGPTPLVDACMHLLQQRGVDARRIHHERFEFR